MTLLNCIVSEDPDAKTVILPANVMNLPTNMMILPANDLPANMMVLTANMMMIDTCEYEAVTWTSS